MPKPLRSLKEELKQNQPFQSDQQELLLTLLRTSAIIRNQLDAKLTNTKLSSQQYNVLRILRGAKEALPTMEISQRLVEPTPGITRLITKLERVGYVKRKQCKKDKRVYHCEITKKGLDHLSELDPIINEFDSHLFDGLSKQTIKQALDSLNQIREVIPQS